MSQLFTLHDDAAIDGAPVSAEYYLEGIDDEEGGQDGRQEGILASFDELAVGSGDHDMLDGDEGQGGGQVGLDNDIHHELRVAVCCHPLYPRLVAEHYNTKALADTPERRSQIIKERDETVRKLTDTIEMAALRESRNTTIKDHDLDSFMADYIELLQGFQDDMKKIHDEVDTECEELERGLEAIRSGRHTSDSEDDEDPASRGIPRLLCPARSMDHDGALRKQLKRRYGDAIVNLRNEFNQKQKKGKLPKESTTRLKKWWHKNIAWPYPSDEDKKRLGQASSLTSTQINNWFINQRKRHWHKLFPKGIPASAAEAKAHFDVTGYPAEENDDSDGGEE